MCTILIAPNSFKGSLSAFEIIDYLEKGMKNAYPGINILKVPVADGGDRTMEVITRIKNGETIRVKSVDPLGREITAEYGVYDQDAAVIEMASSSGLRLLKPSEYDPIGANSFGTGLLVKDALDRGIRKFLLGVGGSATIDGGSGILKALGARFLDHANQEITDGGGGLDSLARVDLTQLDERIKNSEINILCDVENPLLGENGAARVFAPQKGASPEDVELIEQCLTRFSRVTLETTGKQTGEMKHGGAAGGIPAFLHAYLGAKLVPGIEYILDLAGFDEMVKKSQLVITSEGKLDEQTGGGKAPHGVATRAKNQGKPVLFVGGAVPAKLDKDSLFDMVFSISNGPQSLDTAIKNSPALVEQFGYNLGQLIKVLK